MKAPRDNRRPAPTAPRRGPATSPGKPPLRLMTTTLWEYPSQHYDAYVDPDTGEVKRSNIPGGTKLVQGPQAVPRAGASDQDAENALFGAMQGDRAYVGATPSWVIWQCLMRYTRPGDLVIDPMCGSGTTLDVARDLGRRGLGYDLAPSRPDIFRADARTLPVEDAKADFVFLDPPYSTHIDYSDDPACIGKLDSGGPQHGRAYYQAMTRVLEQCHRVLKDRRYLALYVSDSWRKRKKGDPGTGTGEFMPIGFELLSILGGMFRPVDIIAVVRHNQKLDRGNWHKAAAEGNFFLRGFNYLLIVKKDVAPSPPRAERPVH